MITTMNRRKVLPVSLGLSKHPGWSWGGLSFREESSTVSRVSESNWRSIDDEDALRYLHTADCTTVRAVGDVDYDSKAPREHDGPAKQCSSILYELTIP